MKNLKFIVVLCSILIFGAQSVNAQWFQDREINWFSQGGSRGGEDPGGGNSGGGGTGDDLPSPIGSGVAILLGLGAGYACLKHDREKKSGP